MLRQLLVSLFYFIIITFVASAVYIWQFFNFLVWDRKALKHVFYDSDFSPSEIYQAYEDCVFTWKD